VTDVGTEDGVEREVVRVDARVERPGVDRMAERADPAEPLSRYGA
jgi:hypothetical protein